MEQLPWSSTDLWVNLGSIINIIRHLIQWRQKKEMINNHTRKLVRETPLNSTPNKTLISTYWSVFWHTSNPLIPKNSLAEQEIWFRYASFSASKLANYVQETSLFTHTVWLFLRCVITLKGNVLCFPFSSVHTDGWDQGKRLTLDFPT